MEITAIDFHFATGTHPVSKKIQGCLGKNHVISLTPSTNEVLLDLVHSIGTTI